MPFHNPRRGYAGDWRLALARWDRLMQARKQFRMTHTQDSRWSGHATAQTTTPSVAEPTWHALSFEAVKDRLQADVVRGLTQADAARRLVQYGPNALVQGQPRSTLAILLAQFQSLIVA